MTTYENGRLIISLNTTEPAALHELLLKSLVTSLRNYPDSQKKDDDRKHALLDLFEAMLPDKRSLQREFSKQVYYSSLMHSKLNIEYLIKEG